MLTSCSFESDNTDKSTLSSRRVPASPSCPAPRLGEMQRSTQELFLNFMIVLITVQNSSQLMWLLVRSHQESWTVRSGVRACGRAGRLDQHAPTESKCRGYDLIPSLIIWFKKEKKSFILNPFPASVCFYTTLCLYKQCVQVINLSLNWSNF